jgi:hypothetical protein
VGLALAALRPLSNAEALRALKQVCAVFNSHPVSNFAPQGQSQSGAPAQRARKPAERPKPENQAPEVLSLKKELRILQSSIREAARDFEGGVLPQDHPLIQSKDELLAAIIVAKSSFRPKRLSQKGETPQEGNIPSKGKSSKDEKLGTGETPVLH